MECFTRPGYPADFLGRSDRDDRPQLVVVRFILCSVSQKNMSRLPESPENSWHKPVWHKPQLHVRKRNVRKRNVRPNLRNSKYRMPRSDVSRLASRGTRARHDPAFFTPRRGIHRIAQGRANGEAAKRRPGLIGPRLATQCSGANFSGAAKREQLGAKKKLLQIQFLTAQATPGSILLWNGPAVVN